MNENDEGPAKEPLPPQTIEAVAKTIYRQAQEYGFSREDFIRFINTLLDLGLERSGAYVPPPSQQSSLLDHEATQDDKQVTVRLYTDEDYPLLQRWVEDPAGRLFLLTRPDPSHDNSLDRLLEDEDSVFGIVSLDDHPIGALAYLNIDRELGKAELRKLIGDHEARGHGYARRATQYWIEYGVANLGLRKIYVNTLDTNLANIRLNEKLGFRVEGLLREEVKVDDEYRDILRMSLILPH